HVFWGTGNEYAGVGRAELDGSNPDQDFITGLSGYTCGVAVTDAHVYWSEQDANAVGRANIDGSAIDPGLVSGVTGPCGVAVDQPAAPPGGPPSNDFSFGKLKLN